MKPFCGDRWDRDEGEKWRAMLCSDWAPWWLVVAAFETELQVGREGDGV